jgi:hypothetical protein
MGSVLPNTAISVTNSTNMLAPPGSPSHVVDCARLGPVSDDPRDLLPGGLAARTQPSLPRGNKAMTQFAEPSAFGGA